MEVKLAKSCGFCHGVNRAVAIAENAPNSVIIGGDLCHNDSVMARLKRDFNITVEPDHNKITPPQTAIIRSHGIAEQIELDLLNRVINIIDATCPNVKAIQLKIKELDAQGYTIVLFGGRNHPETQGHIGYAKKPIIVLSNSLQAKTLELNGKIAIISQTTMDEVELLKIHQYIKDSHPKNQVILFNTICSATKLNQQATAKLAQTVDVLVVVGGKHSANSNLLVKLAKQYCPAYLIENPSQLEPQWFANKKTCGLSTGVSTPDYLLKAVKSALESLQSLESPCM